MAAKTVKRSPSVLKRARQDEKRNLKNRMVLTGVKTLSKGVLSAIAAKDSANADQALKKAIKGISSAVSKGALHKNTASRRMSTLWKAVNKAFAKA